VNAIERALESKRECAGILQVIWLLAVVLNGQTAVVMERHAQFHVLSPDSRNNSARGHVAKELINIGRIYLK
jgi:DNA-binding FrmR family transcriptional regulator